MRQRRGSGRMSGARRSAVSDSAQPTYFLALDTATLTPTIGVTAPTVTRALNTATCVNSSGVIAVVNANLPRFDYNPVTLACKGLLIEEARTNICLQSQDMATSWSTAATTVDTNQIASPDGTTNADKLTADGTNAAHYLSNTTGTAGARTTSVFAKAGTATILQICTGGTAVPWANFDLTNGTAHANGSGTTAGIESYGNGWYRCWMYTSDASAVDMRLAIVTATNSARLAANTSTGYLYLWGGQCEVAAFVTSYIPTTTASVTRNADVCTVATSNIPSFSAAAGTVCSAFVSPQSNSVAETVWQLDDGTANELFVFSRNANADTTVASSTDGGAGQFSIAPGSLTNSAVSKAAYAWAANDAAASLNGATAVADGTGTLPTVTTLRIGDTTGSRSLNGHVQHIAYWPTRLTNAQLQVITAA